jgi:hypothetical protein
MRSGDPIHPWHMYVQNNDVWLKLNGLFDRNISVLGLTADVERMPIQELANGCSRNNMVIHDQDSRGALRVAGHCLTPVRRWRNFSYGYLLKYFVHSIRGSL